MANAIISCLIVVFCALCINGYYRKCNNKNECEYITMDCIDNQDCSIDCTGYQSCRYSTINCPTNGNCNIQCTNIESCQDTTINGNANIIMNIHCSQNNACNTATINGRYASQLNLLNCETGYYTCLDITIWCPPNINGNKHCTIQGDNSIGGTFYAVNSWNDIQFDTPNKHAYFAGNMYCTTGILSGDYSNNCIIPDNGPWQCTNSNSICQNPPTSSPITSTIDTHISTHTPTISPTEPPTTTEIPTISPTKNPTYFPSTIPAEIPSEIPTVSPTLNPVTTVPSITPTEIPNEIPSVSPIESTMSINRGTNVPSDEVSLEVTDKKTIDGKVNETPETTLYSATKIIPTQFIVPKENAIISAIDSYGLYVIIGILLLVIGCCCLILVIYKGRKTKLESNDHSIEMSQMKRLDMKPRARSLSEIKTMKASPLGIALNTNDLDIMEAEPSVYSHSDYRKKRHHRLSSNSMRMANFYPQPLDSMPFPQQFSIVPTLSLNSSMATSIPNVNSNVSNVNFIGNDIYNYEMYKHDEIEGENENETIHISDDDDEKGMNTETPFNGNALNNIGNSYNDLDVDYINVNVDDNNDDDNILRNNDFTIGIIDENE